MSSVWQNGFLFVGNQLAIDFVNTRPEIDGQFVELLADGRALAQWLAAAGLVGQRESARLMRIWSSTQFTRQVEELRKFREKLRNGLFDIESGSSPSAIFIKELNQLLIEHPLIDHVVKVDSGLERQRRFSPEIPKDTIAPLADATADLITGVELTRVRKCPNCALHFYDTSKKGTRVWCSMRLCGNRSKVAAYAARHRAA